MTQFDKAVSLRGITKQYGHGNKANVVLNHLDMDVEKGTIYGLLGASGCGKTTLLRCIVGRLRIDSGDIYVLGGKPGSRKSGIPGRRLGYMPQEIALVRQFSIRDALEHFAWIYEMTDSLIEERIKFLTELLDLPDLNMKIQDLSGGQQRRVSLAVALIHDPELMILDEPTVGLDPVLRQVIWDHLENLATKKNKTIIITTHYIEEARQAHKIGLMRSGKLLAEGSPDNLLRVHNCNSIEEVFLSLSIHCGRPIGFSRGDQLALPEAQTLDTVEGDIEESGTRNEVISRKNVIGKLFDIQDFQNKPPELLERAYFDNFWARFKFTRKGHMKALMTKNWYRITRHPGAIIFIFFFPMLELCSFYLSVGGNPQGLKLGIVNEELKNYSTCAEYAASLNHYGGRIGYTNEGDAHCTLQGLSCKYLETIDDNVAIKVPYPDLYSAIKDAKAGKLISVIHFTHNYSLEFEVRMHYGQYATQNEDVSGEIDVLMDMSKYQSAKILERHLRNLHQKFINETFNECGANPRVGKAPIDFMEPIYGSWDAGFRQFMTPGVVTTMIFFLAVSVTSTIIVVERLDGIWDRTLLAGVSSMEILASHIVLEAGVIFLQVVEVIIFVFFIFRMPCQGSFASIVLLLALQGFCGMCGGFLLSVSCSSVSSSNFISMGSFYPMLILSGLLWPVEGMPSGLKAISAIIPTTQATYALRNIMEKGWGPSKNYVYQGYLISLLWIFIFSAISMIVVRVRK